MDFETLKDEIKKNEGCKLKAYQLTYNGYTEPFYTIGYGHRVQSNDNIDINKVYSHKDIEKWFNFDFQIAKQGADASCRRLSSKSKRSSY
jgi:GH24 family phage-related lysozyme (muramidase)